MTYIDVESGRLKFVETRRSAGARLPGSFKRWAVAASMSDVGDNAMYFALVWAATAHGGAAVGLVVSTMTIPGLPGHGGAHSGDFEPQPIWAHRSREIV
jgi:hypothetical protein